MGTGLEIGERDWSLGVKILEQLSCVKESNGTKYCGCFGCSDIPFPHLYLNDFPCTCPLFMSTFFTLIECLHVLILKLDHTYYNFC